MTCGLAPNRPSRPPECGRRIGLKIRCADPPSAMIASEGANPQQAIAALLNTAYQLRTATPEQKTQLILNLARQYGANLSQTSPNADEDEYVDPDIKSIRDELTSLKQSNQAQIQATQNQQVQVHQQSIDAFSADRGTRAMVVKAAPWIWRQKRQWQLNTGPRSPVSSYRMSPHRHPPPRVIHAASG